METDQKTKSEIAVLLSFRTKAIRERVKSVLDSSFPKQTKTTEIEQIGDVVEFLEKDKPKFDLIIFEHNSSSVSLVKILLELGKSASLIMNSNEEATFQGLNSVPTPPDFILTADLEASLYRVLKKLSTAAKLPVIEVFDKDTYLTLEQETILATQTLECDIFIKIGTEGRFVCLFNKGMRIEQKDLEKYSKGQKEIFFVRKTDIAQALKERALRLEQAAKNDVSLGDAKKQFSESLASVRDSVSKMGFTEEAQAVAKSCVSMALKALGSKPSLAGVLAQLDKNKDDNYLLSHSFMIGHVACALAYKIGWNSAPTYLKLTLAGFLHDISLTTEKLALVNSFEEADESGNFSKQELQTINLHASKSADYSRQFGEIPSDVDQIISQHHERPDGTGFPRKMSGKLISPLSALFIMAHDLVHALHENPRTNAEMFFEIHAKKYQVGQFRKILASLNSPTEAGE